MRTDRRAFSICCTQKYEKHRIKPLEAHKIPVKGKLRYSVSIMLSIETKKKKCNIFTFKKYMGRQKRKAKVGIKPKRLERQKHLYLWPGEGEVGGGGGFWEKTKMVGSQRQREPFLQQGPPSPIWFKTVHWLPTMDRTSTRADGRIDGHDRFNLRFLHIFKYAKTHENKYYASRMS